MGISFLLNSGFLKLLKSKWFWVSLAIIFLVGGAFLQHKSIVKLELKNQRLDQERIQLKVQLTEVEASKAKLLEDVARMAEINQTLQLDKSEAEERLKSNREHLQQVMDSLSTLSTEKDVTRARGKVQSIVIQSYKCIEQATGNEGSTCER